MITQSYPAVLSLTLRVPPSESSVWLLLYSVFDFLPVMKGVVLIHRAIYLNIKNNLYQIYYLFTC